MADHGADKDGDIAVQVCFAKPGVQILRDMTVAPGTTVEDAIRRSGVLDDAPEIDLSVCKVGIYGKLKPLDTALRDRDRIEIYRPLIADPMESRRKRAEKKDSQGDKKAR
ncbi:MAG: rnfH Ubiquitin family protein [Burkholderia sp.]|nr:rnfH Ubiquitin family protein [Burkholderia sp.]